MKEKIFAVIAIISVIAIVAFNTAKLNNDISEIYDAVSTIDTNESAKSAEKRANEVYNLFRSKELFIGLTVNHDDLSNIEEDFAEMIGYLSICDNDGAAVTKNRLLDSLSHLRRLSGFNIDAII